MQNIVGKYNILFVCLDALRGWCRFFNPKRSDIDKVLPAMFRKILAYPLGCPVKNNTTHQVDFILKN